MTVEERNQLVEKNLPLAHYLTTKAVEFARAKGKQVDSDAIFSAAQFGLVVASRRYNPDRGVPFGAYASTWISSKIGHALFERAKYKRSRERQGPEHFDQLCRVTDKHLMGVREEAAILLSILSERELEIVERLIYRGERRDTVAFSLGITTERVRQILEKALRRMREYGRSKGLGPLAKAG